MKRREFLGLLSGTAASLPLMVHAQGRIPVVGFISGASNAGGAALVECFLTALRDHGWIDGKSIKIEVRWSEGLADRYVKLANELANLPLDIIVVTSTPGTRAVQRAKPSVPVVFMGVSDPVESGFVKSLSAPGGNLTGVSNFLPATTDKLIEYLKLVSPTADRFCVLHNPTNTGKMIEVHELQAAGRDLSVRIEPIEVRSAADFTNAFNAITRFNCDALITLQEGVTLGARRHIADFASTHRIPSAFQIREFVTAGGLLSYGLNYCQHYRRGAAYVDKILRGARPGDLPIELPTKFELVVNLKTARTLGLTVPQSLLISADEVIE